MRQKKCKFCGSIYTPSRPLQSACSVACALGIAKVKRVKKDRQDTLEARRKIKTLAEWRQDAQTAFNRFIRLRDSAEPCISCGRYHQGQIHAGHYRTTKAASGLRFHPFNCHAQCAPCNSHLSGNIVEYRPRLIAKIGLDNVEWLESQNTVYRWSIEELREIKAWYTQLARQITT